MQHRNQTTKYTCAASALAMIINHFKPEFELTVDNEFDIWHKSVALPTKGSSIYALAIYAHKIGIPLRVVVGDKSYKFPYYKFKSYKKKEIELAEFFSNRFYSEAKNLGIGIEERSFDLEEVKSLLKKKKILLLRLIVGVLRNGKENKRISHYLPVYGYGKKGFKLIDPRAGAVEIDEKTFKAAFDKVKEVKRDNRMIIFG